MDDVKIIQQKFDETVNMLQEELNKEQGQFDKRVVLFFTDYFKTC